MAVSPPPHRKPAPAAAAAASPVRTVNDKKIDAVINRGSSALGAAPSAPEQIKHFNIKLTAGTLAAIDAQRANRPRRSTSPKLGISTQDWLAEAIAEKLAREQKKHKTGA